MQYHALSVADGRCFTLSPKASHFALVIYVGRRNYRTNRLNELAVTEEKDNRPFRQISEPIECHLGSP